jgi:hypothetical protein
MDLHSYFTHSKQVNTILTDETYLYTRNSTGYLTVSSNLVLYQYSLPNGSLVFNQIPITLTFLISLKI